MANSESSHGALVCFRPPVAADSSSCIFQPVDTTCCRKNHSEMIAETRSRRARIQCRLLVMTLTGVLAGTVGCSRASDQPELGLVSGSVTLDGAPLPGVTITFSPNDGRPAMGQTDVEGSYKLTYIRDTPGCKVGRSRVQIGNTEESVVTEFLELEGDDLIQNPRRAKSKRIPSRYNTKSQLEAVVQPGQNTFDFSLISRP